VDDVISKCAPDLADADLDEGDDAASTPVNVLIYASGSTEADGDDEDEVGMEETVAMKLRRAGVARVAGVHSGWLGESLFLNFALSPRTLY
jgi:hypothetical protein